MRHTLLLCCCYLVRYGEEYGRDPRSDPRRWTAGERRRQKTILGAILLDNAAHAEAAEKLESDDFSLDSHRRIFLRMSELMDAQRAVNIVTLANELDRYKELDAVGGRAYLFFAHRGFATAPGH